MCNKSSTNKIIRKTRIWRIEFNSFIQHNITANTIGEAIEEALIRKNGEHIARIKDIQEITLLAEIQN